MDNQILEDLKQGVIDLARKTITDFTAEAIQDGQSMLNSMKSDLENWAAELASGDLTEADLAFLIKGKIELSEMVALKQKGIAQIRLEQFQNGVIDLVVKAVSKAI